MKKELTPASSDALAKAVQGLVADASARSETARLRDVFDTIEAALAAGVKREAVLGQLQAQGFGMTMNSFKSALSRIRKERRDGER